MLKSFSFIFFASFFANADMNMNMAEAKMAAPELISSSITVNYFEKQQKQRKLSVEESEILSLTLIARDVFANKDFAVYGGGPTEESRVQSIGLLTVANSIQDSIQLREWNQPLSNSDLNKIKKQSALLKKALGEDSFAVAWLTYQAGDKAEAKNILNRGFTKSYEETMKVQHIYRGRPGSLQNGESFSKALMPMSNDEENKSRAEKLKKMQMHISSLPDMQMMT